MPDKHTNIHEQNEHHRVMDTQLYRHIVENVSIISIRMDCMYHGMERYGTLKQCNAYSAL